MLARSSKALPVVTEGTNVAAPVSAFDRIKGDPPNVIGVVIFRSEKVVTSMAPVGDNKG